MNIVKLQKQLETVPDQALIGYVRDLGGPVPSYLALAEIERRKELRKQAAPQQAAPTQTIADQMVAQVEPGIAGLPVRDDMYNEQSMAAGGIVAFEDGGEVQGFFKGGLPGLSEDDVAYQEALRQAELPSWARTGLDYTAFLPYTLGKKGVDYLKGRQPVYDPVQGKYVLQRDMPPVDTKAAEDAAFKARMDKGLKTREDYLKANPAAQPVAERVNAEQSRIDKTKAFLEKQAAENLADPAYIANVNKHNIMRDIAAGKYNDTTPPPTPSVGDQPRGAVPAGLEFVPGADLSGEYDTMLRPEISAQEAMNKYQGLLGTDVARERMKERLEGMEAKAAKDEERAPWMALAEAGLGMAAGTSQFAIQNIAEGGKRGIKSFVDAKDRLAKAEERRFEMDSKIAQAERAEQVAAATYGLQSEEATKARNEANRMAKLGYEADRESTIAKGNFEAKKFNLEYAQKDKEIALMDKRIDKQIQAMENQSQRYELNNQRDSLKALLQRSSDQLKTMLPDPKNPEYVAALNEYNRYAKQLEDLANRSYSLWGDVSVGKPK